MSRVDLQLDRIKKRLVKEINPGIVLSEMNQVQSDLCKDYLAFKKRISLVLESGIDKYPLGSKIFKIKEIFEPSTWLLPLEIISESAKFNAILKSTSSVYDQPVYGFIWDKLLQLWPVAPIVTGAELDLLVYAFPSKELAFGADPEVGTEWDESLFLGTLNKLEGGDWNEKYLEEASKQMTQAAKEAVKGVIKKESFIDETGF